ncbi:MAG: phytoene/squalene synthase family protein [Pseudomonadota bacterium]
MTDPSHTGNDLLASLKATDPVRYAAVLYMPEEKRLAVASLWLFQTQIERIRDLVSEPLPGEIRLQWWRDVLDGVRDGEARQNPLAAALIETVDTNGLSRDRIGAYLETMVFDLYDDPMPDIGQFEGHMGETHSVFFQMVCQILLGEPLQNGDAAGHAGVAYGVSQCLLSLAKHRSRGQIYLPAELFANNSVSIEEWRAFEISANKCEAVKEFAAYGYDHLSKAKAALVTLPKACHPALLPLAVSAKVFRDAQKDPATFLASPVAYGALQVHWSILVAALRGL